MNHSPPAISFIGIVDFSQDAKWLYMTDSVTELLGAPIDHVSLQPPLTVMAGYEPSDLIGQPSLDLVHPDEFPSIRQLHYDTILQDKAACLVYLRMKHKDPFRGYILCGVDCGAQRARGQRLFCEPGAKALHNASTAQEITVITPSAANFQFRRWHDPSPMPPSPIPQEMANVNLAEMLQRTSPAPSSSSSWGSKSPRSPRNSQSPPGRSARAGSPHPERSPTLSGAEERDKEREGEGRDNGRQRDGERNGGREERDAEGRRRRGDRGGRSSRSRSRSPSPSRSLSISRERSSKLAHRARNGSGSSTHAHVHAHAYDPRRNGHSHPSSHPHPYPPSIANIPIISFEPPANKSFRTAFILDRFTMNCTIMYCSNDLLVSTTEAIGRSFYDFVSRRDEEIVQSWIGCVKGWGVNEKGQPSDGGFGFGRFMLLPEGRDSGASRRIPEPPTPSRHRDRHGTHSHGQAHHPHQRRPSNNPHGHSRPTPRARAQTHTSTPSSYASSSPSSYNPSRSPTSPHSPTSPYASTSGAYSSGAYSSSTSHSHSSHSHAHSPTSTRSPYAHPPAYSTSQITQGMHTMNVHGLEEANAEKFEVDAIFSAHSDGLMVILRRAS
ncbi:unnamed protein product [Cyclocybe aegerita]|uniref:PAS domain-containing protein n=1 Tax=Cyclocybe aegerita TaxID=1973307 RepID=A0A8S0VYX5_CYCAE|nr:unnamed protein product [Cyclocybe aegerita]